MSVRAAYVMGTVHRLIPVNLLQPAYAKRLGLAVCGGLVIQVAGQVQRSIANLTKTIVIVLRENLAFVFPALIANGKSLEDHRLMGQQRP